MCVLMFFGVLICCIEYALRNLLVTVVILRIPIEFLGLEHALSSLHTIIATLPNLIIWISYIYMIWADCI